MAKLDTNRMANSTKLNKVDDAHVDLEGDLEEILGVPDNTVITSPIFGAALSGLFPVNADGTISGVMKLLMSSASSVATECVGFEFSDGTATKRLIFSDSGLKIWEYVDNAWSQVADIEVPGSGSGLLKNLADCADITTLVGQAGKLVAVNVGEDSFTLVEPASASGIMTFAGMTDTPASYNGTSFDPADAGKIVAVASGGAATELIAAPTGAGDPFVMYLGATVNSTWGRNQWIDVYEWAFVNIGADGDLLFDDTSVLSNDATVSPVAANKFIELEKGIYEINFWTATSTPSPYGIRQWRVAGTASNGQAILGASRRANTYYHASTGLNASIGIQDLGTRSLIQIAQGDIKFQVYQDSPGAINNSSFSAIIHKVK